MIIKNIDDVTPAVLNVMQRTEDPRLREILVALVKHLHGFAREVALTESEFQKGAVLAARLGQLTSDTHNEVVLMCGSLGLSQLICMMNNGTDTPKANSASLLGPFWRLNSPSTENGASIVRSETPGAPLFFSGQVVDISGEPVPDAEVDIWHSSPTGFYENQDSRQVDMNLRGKFTTDAKGRFAFRSVRPAGYPIPVNGVVGELLTAQGRHPYRPAHIHALIFKPGYKTIAAQVYDPEDPYYDSDVQFGVTASLTGAFIRHDESHPNLPDMSRPWFSVDHRFTIEPGEAKLPRPPIR